MISTPKDAEVATLSPILELFGTSVILSVKIFSMKGENLLDFWKQSSEDHKILIAYFTLRSLRRRSVKR